MVQQIALRPPDEQRSPREPSGSAYAAVPDLIVASRRRVLAGVARLRASVVVVWATLIRSGLFTALAVLLLCYITLCSIETIS